MRIFIALLTTVFLSGCFAAARVPSRAHTNRSFEPTSFVTTHPRCYLDQDGRGSCHTSFGSFTVALPVHDDRLQTLFVEASAAGLLFVYQYGTVETAGARVALVSSASARPVWTRDLFGFNLGPPLLSRDAIYVTTSNVIAKLRRHDGALLWSHSDLHRSHGRFASFGRTALRGHTVVFTERQPEAYHDAGVWQIVVDDETGSIIRVGPRGGV